ncbi:MAG: serine hydrolase [Tissierellia bacterium]|nr:serine hydrolase [Tissierellia bacterium]
MTLEDRIKIELTSYNGKMALYLRDFKGNHLAINEDESFETASIIKSFILLDLFEQVERGDKSLDEELVFKEEFRVDGSGVLHSMVSGLKMSAENFAILMIIVSDNTATNIMIDYLGIDRINETIEKYGFSSTKLLNPICWDKYDDLGISTARDYGEFFYKLYKGELVSPEACKKMIEIFKNQHYNSMLIRDFPQYYLSYEDSTRREDFEISVASKSGSMDACRNDGGIIYTPLGDYVLVLFHKEFFDPLYHSEHEATLYGAKVSRLILDHFLAKEGQI